jgi:hypothetical protein
VPIPVGRTSVLTLPRFYAVPGSWEGQPSRDAKPSPTMDSGGGQSEVGGINSKVLNANPGNEAWKVLDVTKDYCEGQRACLVSGTAFAPS